MLGAPAATTAVLAAAAMFAAAASTASAAFTGAVAVSIVCQVRSGIGRAAVSTAAPAAPGIIRVGARTLLTNGDGLSLDILAPVVVLRMHSIVAGEVLASPIGLQGSILLG